MAESEQHNKIIQAISRERLLPLGLKQKGKSRVWLDDQGWRLTVVEFQPSDWEKGTYLNVGSMWLWRTNKHLSFDLGSRVAGLLKFDEAFSFESNFKKIADQAVAEVEGYRRRLATINQVADETVRHAEGCDWSAWPTYHAGVASALAGRKLEAINILSKLTNINKNEPEWMIELEEDVKMIINIINDKNGYYEIIKNRIINWRIQAKLIDLDMDNILRQINISAT